MTARLFFAAWPDNGVQQALHAVALRARSECGGRAIAQRNIHLTLAFLGDVARERLVESQSVAAGSGGLRCDLAVDRLQYWKHNRILWAGVERCPQSLVELVGRLTADLRAGGFKLDERAYVPHITLLRNARRAPTDRMLPRVLWPIVDFALIESAERGDGRVYEVVERWPLNG